MHVLSAVVIAVVLFKPLKYIVSVIAVNMRSQRWQRGARGGSGQQTTTHVRPSQSPLVNNVADARRRWMILMLP